MTTSKIELRQNIDRFNTAMLTTMSAEGVLHSRPMRLAKREGDVLWFATHLDSTAVEEVRIFQHANVTFQSPLLYISVSGPAAVVPDRVKVQELWTESWSAWFPNGPHDPDLVLMKLEIKSADTWDMRGAKGIRSALRALTSMVARQLDSAEGVQSSMSL